MARIAHVRLLYAVPILINPHVAFHLYQSVQNGDTDRVGTQNTTAGFCIEDLVIVDCIGVCNVIEEVFIIRGRSVDLLHISAENDSHCVVLREHHIFAKDQDKRSDIFLRVDGSCIIASFCHVREDFPSVIYQIAVFPGMQHINSQFVFRLCSRCCAASGYIDCVIGRGRTGHRSTGNISKDHIPVGASVLDVTKFRNNIADHNLSYIRVRTIGCRESPVGITHVALCIARFSRIEHRTA